MKSLAPAILVIALVVCMGAQVQSTNYEKACLGFQTEALVVAELRSQNAGDDRVKAALARRAHWLKIIEGFKP